MFTNKNARRCTISRRRFLQLGGTLSATGLLAACGGGSSGAPAQSGAGGASGGTPIRVAYSTWVGALPWQVALEKGLFDKNQVAVDLRVIDGYVDSINALAAGQVDANNITLGDVVTMTASGTKLVVPLVNDISNGIDMVVAENDIADVAGLRGKKVGAEQGTANHYLLLLGLEQAGLTQNDIDYTPIAASAGAAAFAAGQLNAMSLSAPFDTQALSTNRGKMLFSSKEFPGAIADILTIRQEVVEARRDDVQRLINTWFDTLAFIDSNPDEATTIMAQRAGMAESDFNAMAAGIKRYSVDDNLRAFTPGNDVSHLDFAARSLAEFQQQTGITTSPADVSAILDGSFVAAYAEANKSSS
jgi:NitT/TauT family transport system substrate-binding protein